MQGEFEINFSNRQSLLPVCDDEIRQKIRLLLNDRDVARAELSIVFLDNASIHAINREYLDHDEPTDVITFSLEDDFESGDSGGLSGEILVSAEMAINVAQEIDWPAGNELLLYIAHGILHLLGFDDLTEEPRRRMREAERQVMQLWGIPMTTQSPSAELTD